VPPGVSLKAVTFVGYTTLLLRLECGLGRNPSRPTMAI